jgi:hypothetical protein
MAYPISAAAGAFDWTKVPSSARSMDQMLARLESLRDNAPPKLQLLEADELAPIPDVPQEPIERFRTTRAPSEVQEGFQNRRRTLLRDVERGMESGAHRWYWAEPVRQQFISELGEAEGIRQYNLFADMVAGSSSAAEVVPNIRKGSWYRQQALEGLLPSDIDTKAAAADWLEHNPPPPGYGSVARHNDVMWTSRFLGGPQLHRAAEPGASHKILSFDQNLRGNLEPWTGDRHEGMRLGVPAVWNSREKSWEKGMLKSNEYVAAEDMIRRLADKAGLAPAEFQSARWLGGGHVTGVDSTQPSFAHAFEEAVMNQAKRTGETPEWVLRNFIRNGGLLAAPAVIQAAGDNQ